MSRNFVRRIQTFTATMAFVALIAIFLPAGSLGQQRDPHPTKEQSRRAESGSVGFLPVVTYDAGGGTTAPPGSLAVADINGDGKPDLIVANTPVGGGVSSVGVMLGNGDGTFRPVVLNTSVQQVGELNALAVTDVNGDGKPDVVVIVCCASNGDFEAAVLLGNGDGTFQSAVTYDDGGRQFSVLAVGDVNGDGRPDIVVVNWVNGNNQATANTLLGNGDGTFQPFVSSNAPSDPSCASLADMNHDGKLDLLTCGENTVSVQLGNGDGTFQTYVNHSFYAGYCISTVLVTDVNADAVPDMVVPNPTADGQIGCGSDGFAGILSGNGDGTFQPEVNYLALGFTNEGVGSGAVGDLNGDGKIDVMVTTGLSLYGSVHGSVGVLLGNGDGSFQTASSFDAGGPQSQAVVAADLNGDGKVDIVVANFGSGTVGVLLNAGATQTSTNTTIVSSLNPSNSGQAVTFTATVSSASGTPTGTVVFYDSTTVLGSATLGSGSASLSTSSLAVGSHSITAAYQGSGTFAPSTSPLLTQVVKGTGIATTTTLTSSKNPGIYQQPVTFTAVVTSGSGTPTGTVVFYDGTATLASATLVNGSASFTTSDLKRGWAAMTASYLGAGSFDPSTSPVLYERVDKNGLFQTRIHLSSSNRSSYVGQAVTFTVSLSALRRGEIPQDGDQVQFFDGNNFIGYGTTQNGVASVTTSSLTARPHIIGAYFPGDDDFSHAYTQITQIVNKYGTSVRVTASPNPALYGQAITFTATVTSAGPNTPTGSVKFKDIGEATLSGGVATFVKNSLRAGTHAVTAEYLGDADSGESTSPVLDEVVNPASTTTTITSSANPSSSGQTVTFTATVTSSTGLDPFGKVTFTAGGATLGTVSLKDTVAAISTATLPVGTSTITATYNGSPGFTGSGASLTQTVNP
jgi:uncharacterized repeat protein (TIGR01451 family)